LYFLKVSSVHGKLPVPARHAVFYSARHGLNANLLFIYP